MALALGTNSQLNFTFKDNNRNIANTGLYLATAGASTLTTIADDMNVIRDALVPLSSAQLLQGSAFTLLDEQADELAPAPESDVRRKLVLVFRTTNRYSQVRMEIPSPVFTIETDNTNEVDPADPLVAALVTAIANALGTGSFQSPTGYAITALERAYIDVRQRSGAGR